MKKIYYLSTCNTCTKILKELHLPSDFELQNLKEKPLSEAEIEFLKNEAGTYEALFNRRAILYRERDLKNKSLSEADYKALLKEHYSFVKRPILVNENKVFIGNNKKIVAAAIASVI